LYGRHRRTLKAVTPGYPGRAIPLISAVRGAAEMSQSGC
jgi:hypothetical protein